MTIKEEELQNVIQNTLNDALNILYEENSKLNNTINKLKADLKKLKVKYKNLTNIHSKFKEFISCLPYSINEDGEIE